MVTLYIYGWTNQPHLAPALFIQSGLLYIQPRFVPLMAMCVSYIGQQLSASICSYGAIFALSVTLGGL